MTVTIMTARRGYMGSLVLLCSVFGLAACSVQREETPTPTASATPESIITNTPGATEAPTMTVAATSTADWIAQFDELFTNTPLPTVTFVATSTQMVTYRNEEYGFTFQYPSHWRMEEHGPSEHDGWRSGSGLWLMHNDVRLTIGYKWATDKDAYIGCTGTGAGSPVESEAASFFGHSIRLTLLVFEGGIKSIDLGGLCHEIIIEPLAFSIKMGIYEADYRRTNLYAWRIEELQQILATFAFLEN